MIIIKIFVDFEATQPYGEIIAFGAKAETGEEFFRYIKPQLSILTPMITELTGITAAILNVQGWLFDSVMRDFSDWCDDLEKMRYKLKFYSYGMADKQFLINSFPTLSSNNAINITSYIIATMKDYSENVTHFFNGSTSLIKAYNYFKEDKQQKHNALEDAKMLAEVFGEVQFAKPLDRYPFQKKEEEKFNWPTGIFYCKSQGKNTKEYEFNNSHLAVEWLIKNKIGIKRSAEVHRDRIAKNIMKAIRRKTTYMGYYWRRVKNV
mgnify:CR=1 FL=1